MWWPLLELLSYPGTLSFSKEAADHWKNKYHVDLIYMYLGPISRTIFPL